MILKLILSVILIKIVILAMVLIKIVCSFCSQDQNIGILFVFLDI